MIVMWTNLVLPSNIHKRNEYYYLDSAKLTEPVFKIYSSTTVTVVSQTIKNPKPSGVSVCVLRSIIDGISPIRDYVLDIQATYGSVNIKAEGVSMANVLNDAIVSYPNMLVWSMSVCGLECIEINDEFHVITKGAVAKIPKFKDSGEGLMHKLNCAMNKVILNLSDRSSSFVHENTEEGFRLEVTVRASETLLKSLGASGYIYTSDSK